MMGKNAVSIAENTAPEPVNSGTLSLVRSKVAVADRRSVPSILIPAVERAFCFRYAVLKRALDIILSLLSLIVLWPFGLVIALLIKITSPGPVFYCEERLGRFCVPFRIIKFRSMYIPKAHSKVLDISQVQRRTHEANRFQKRIRDPRITPLGRVLRRMSLDELPQLWNVLRGDMSLVGPRPVVNAERHLYGQYLPCYDLFLPGITGLWQVSGRSDLNYNRRVLLDRQYASNWSCGLDLIILVRTIPAVVSMRGAY